MILQYFALSAKLFLFFSCNLWIRNSWWQQHQGCLQGSSFSTEKQQGFQYTVKLRFSQFGPSAG